MKRITTIILLVFISLFTAACGNKDATQQNDLYNQSESDSGQSNSGTEESSQLGEANNLELSDMIVTITSNGNIATFQLYDTVAAAEFYEQLPLELELSNFRDAQWMFYPPNKLKVTEAEAYHDGKRGELSYYEPWGDVFMLYEDFYAGDEMHRLGVGITGIDGIAAMSGEVTITKDGEASARADENIPERNDGKVKISVGDNTFTATLANNSSAKALKELLADGAITVQMTDYGGFEKVGSLGTNLPTNNEQITTELGDIILYQGNQLVIYYESNSWNFTRLGKIDDTTGLQQALGNGNVTVVLTLE